MSRDPRGPLCRAAKGSVDERGFEAVRRIRRTQSDISLSDFKERVREQFYILLIDMEAALAALPSMFPADVETRHEAFDLVKQIMSACGPLSSEDNERLQRVPGRSEWMSQRPSFETLRWSRRTGEAQAKAL